MASRTYRVVYVSYDGLDDPLGQSQVLPYLKGLADFGHRIDLLTFEKPGSSLHFRAPVYPGLRWTALRYHKEPSVPATAFDMAQGGLTVALARLFGRTDIVHTRSYVAATLALPYLAVSRARFLFDMRGLWADEAVLVGRWSETSRIYHSAKRMEEHLVSRATAITVLTQSMQRYLRDEAAFRRRIRAPIWVIPTCTDLERFSLDVQPDPRATESLKDCTPLVYSGSFGGRYLSQEMARFYLAFRQHVKNPRLLVISKMDPTQIREILGSAGAEAELVHFSAAYSEVPAFLRAAAAGVFFYPPGHTSRGVAPTKMGEMLACGLPCAGNLVGDVPEVLGEPGAGVVLHDFSDAALDGAARQLADLVAKPERQRSAREVAHRWFSLYDGVRAYHELYGDMMTGAENKDHIWPRAGGTPEQSSVGLENGECLESA